MKHKKSPTETNWQNDFPSHSSLLDTRHTHDIKRPQFQKYSPNYYFISVAQQPDSGPGNLTVEVSRSHRSRHTHPAGLLFTSDQLVAEAANFTTHKKHNRQTSMPSAGFEPAIPAIKRLQTYALDRTATEIGSKYY